MINIALFGAGNLGSRYLQGLVGTDYQIFVFDPNPEAIQKAKTRIKEVREENKNFYFLEAISDLPSQINLAIVSTSANCRSEIVKTINNNSEVDFFILEKLLAQNSKQVNDLLVTTKKNKKVWVNTPRRLMPWYQNIKSQFFDNDMVFNCNVTGGNWGLITNSIHFIDLFSWISESQVVEIDSKGIHTWFESKRLGYFDAFGFLKVIFKNGSILYLNSTNCDDELKLKFKNSENEIRINEEKGIAYNLNDSKEISGQLLFQSKLTKLLVDKIINFGDCDLPTLKVSSNYHICYLDSLLDSWNSLQMKKDSTLKIT